MIFSKLAQPLSITLISMTIRRVKQTAKQYCPALLCRSQPTSCYVLSFILYAHRFSSPKKGCHCMRERMCMSTCILLPFLADLSLQKSCSVGVCMIKMLFQECLSYLHLYSFCFTARHVMICKIHIQYVKYQMIDWFFREVLKKHFYNLFRKRFSSSS